LVNSSTIEQGDYITVSGYENAASEIATWPY